MTRNVCVFNGQSLPCWIVNIDFNTNQQYCPFHWKCTTSCQAGSLLTENDSGKCGSVQHLSILLHGPLAKVLTSAQIQSKSQSGPNGMVSYQLEGSSIFKPPQVQTPVEVLLAWQACPSNLCREGKGCLNHSSWLPPAGILFTGQKMVVWLSHSCRTCSVLIQSVVDNKTKWEKMKQIPAFAISIIRKLQ